MTYICNRQSLLAHGDTRLRAMLLDIAEQCLDVADPGAATRRLVRLEGDTLWIGERRYALQGRRVFVIGAGKASYPIAKALDSIIGRRIHAGDVTCKYGQEGEIKSFGLHLARHPIPDWKSIEAATRTLSLIDQVRADDIVIACFTGGSSALFALPVPGVTLEDKATATSILLTCGANIVEINAVRKHLSLVKGGRLAARLPAGATLINLTVSDVIGDALDYITDPTVPDTSSFADARATLDKYALWGRLPDSICRHIRAAHPDGETIREDGLAKLRRQDVLLASGDDVCARAIEAARERGVAPLLLSTSFEGESRELGRNLAAVVTQILKDGNPSRVPCLLIGGGETTVTFDDARGLGGPNQELASSMAIALAGREGVAGLALDTDGTDGPTDIAGALVDGSTFGRAASLGIDLRKCLVEHNVSPALVDLGDAVVTGATGTNVNDLLLVLVAPS
jgi:glycerate 2-kinase